MIIDSSRRAEDRTCACISFCLYSNARLGRVLTTASLQIRSVSELQTAIGDSRLPNVLLNIIETEKDNRVVLIALMGIANMGACFHIPHLRIVSLPLANFHRPNSSLSAMGTKIRIERM